MHGTEKVVPEVTLTIDSFLGDAMRMVIAGLDQEECRSWLENQIH
jgi:hypothetical protein